MEIRKFFKTKLAEKRPAYSFFLGAFFTIVSFFTSFLLFKGTPNFIGISTILFTVILVMPIANKLFYREERLEINKKLGFLKKHEHIIDFFVYFFIGVFIVLFAISLPRPNMVFSEQQLYNIQAGIIEEGRKLPPPPLGSGNGVLIIFKNNLYVMVISFVLSLFYGAGALFLITLNASIFASALARVIRISLQNMDFFVIKSLQNMDFLFTNTFLSAFGFTLCNLGIMFFHLIPEVSGYLLAAISGGVLSRALIKEKINSENFRIVFFDSIKLLIGAIIFLMAAAFIENKISRELFNSDVCIDSKITIIFIHGLILAGIILFELIRKKEYLAKKFKRFK